MFFSNQPKNARSIHSYNKILLFITLDHGLRDVEIAQTKKDAAFKRSLRGLFNYLKRTERRQY